MISHFMRWSKDGGPESPVDAFWLIEMKGLFSIAILKFNAGMREPYHNHAFNAWTWFLAGDMCEHRLDGGIHFYKRSLKPKYTPRTNAHRVRASRKSWCLTVRGPWSKDWNEWTDDKMIKTTLSNGRVVESAGICENYCGGQLFTAKVPSIEYNQDDRSLSVDYEVRVDEETLAAMIDEVKQMTPEEMLIRLENTAPFIEEVEPCDGCGRDSEYYCGVCTRPNCSWCDCVCGNEDEHQ